jgi:murein DD-endopeptidase MepM/ murein hydrolase activator NlpD
MNDRSRRLCLSLIGIVLMAACTSSDSPTNASLVGSRWIWRDNCPVAYPAQESSPYVLPYEPGRSFVTGGNCEGAHPRFSPAQYAYDFVIAHDPVVPMPIGTPIVAAREGEVILVEERFANGTPNDHEDVNSVRIRHADGTVASYDGLTTNGALVAVGDRVARGQVIALSGDTSDALGLHFMVLGCDDCAAIPVTFRNTRPHPRGLIAGESYRAE